MLKLQFVEVLEFTVNGFSVEEMQTTMAMSVNFKILLINEFIREAKRFYFEKRGNRRSDPQTGQKHPGQRLNELQIKCL